MSVAHLDICREQRRKANERIAELEKDIVLYKKNIELLIQQDEIVQGQQAELEAELKWLQRQHVRVCSNEDKLQKVVQIAQELVDDYTIVDDRLRAALAALEVTK